MLRVPQTKDYPCNFSGQPAKTSGRKVQLLSWQRGGKHVVIVRASNAQRPAGSTERTAYTVVWLKHDLRLDDHPGFLQASEGALPVVPLFCLQPELYVHLLRTPFGVEGLLGSLANLRHNLRKRGSDLVLRSGPLHSAFHEVLHNSQASIILAEEEVEHRWLTAIRDVQAGLPADTLWRFWKTSLFMDEPYAENFREFQRLRGRPIAPLPPPEVLPGLPPGLHAGDIPSVADLRASLAEADAAALHPEVLREAQGVVEAWPPSGTPQLANDIVGGGESAALAALSVYVACRQHSPALCFAGPAHSLAARPADDALQRRMEAAVDEYETPAAPLGSFPAVFSRVMSLGLLSRRRVYDSAAQQLQQQPWSLGLLPGGGGTLPARSAQLAAETADFHWHLARADRQRRLLGGNAPRHWRWRGHMIDYCSRLPSEEGAAELADEPALLLVHGFGAFGQQWRGQLGPLAAAGHQVYAPTIPGFGRSEKPALAYSQALWLDFLRDFVIEVVRRPVVVVGNSIGGYISASLAAACPGIVKGLVLVNTAGKIDPSFDAALEAAASGSAKGKAGPPALLADIVSRGLFAYLERSIARTLVRLYPVAPANADERLAEEIFRAACDPGALAVFRSVFYLPKPLPLNHLVGNLYGGPALVLQGALDPLNDARARARALQEACPNVRVRLLDGGHCPHDEVPETFNTALRDFVQCHVSVTSSSLEEVAAAAS